MSWWQVHEDWSHKHIDWYCSRKFIHAMMMKSFADCLCAKRKYLWLYDCFFFVWGWLKNCYSAAALSRTPLDFSVRTKIFIRYVERSPILDFLWQSPDIMLDLPANNHWLGFRADIVHPGNYRQLPNLEPPWGFIFSWLL